LEKNKNIDEPVILGLETSGRICGVSVTKGAEMLVEMNINAYRSHTEKIFNLIVCACDNAGVTFSDIDLIAVSMGPGSYTGLRVGLSTAKGFAYSLGKPVAGISTFNVLAYPFRDYPGRVFIIIPSKSGEYYLSELSVEGNCEAGTGKVNVIMLPELYEKIKLKKSGICGIFNGMDLDYVRNSLGCCVLGMPEAYPRSYCVSLLGYEKYRKKEFSDLDIMEPFYFKDFPDKNAS